MNSLPQSGVDLRAFTWRLLPLERKLGWERDACMARLAQSLAALDVSRQQLQQLEALQEDHATRALGDPVPDAHAHRHLLHYLGSIQLRLRQSTNELRLREQEVARARAAWVACERGMQALLAARKDAMRAYVRVEALRSDRQTDAAWLMHQQQQRRQQASAP